jgi:GWxTD domain-containing protein
MSPRNLMTALLLGIAVAVPAAAIDSDKLREITSHWRKGKSNDFQVETYLRRVVLDDAGFRPDSTLSPARLSSEARAVYDGLEPLLTPSMQLQYLGLSSDSLRHEWVRRFWLLKDPTPTTPENERRREHDLRVETAKRRFAWKEPPYWDDRGAIWIAFGEPDSIIEEVATVEQGVGYVAANSDWLYTRERWVVAFERPNPRGPWKLGRSSTRLSWRPDLVARDKRRLWATGSGNLPAFDEIGPDVVEQRSDLFGFMQDRELLAAGDYEGLDNAIVAHGVRTDLRARDLLAKRKEALVRFQQKFESRGERFVQYGEPIKPLWFVFDVSCFKGPPGRMRVEVHYQINLQDLQFAYVDSIYESRYTAEATLLNADAREVARDSYVERITADTFRNTLLARLVPGQLHFDIPEGSYRLSIRCRDAKSGAEGTYVTLVEVPRIDDRSLSLSDVQMATSIVYAGDDWRSRFVKKDRLIVPNPIGIVPRGKPLVGYFEIYGLQLDANSTCRYEVVYSIAPRSPGRPQGWFPDPGSFAKPFVTSRFTGDGGTSNLEEELRVDVASLASDAYDLVLTVRDLVAGTEATRRSRFSILD